MEAICFESNVVHQGSGFLLTMESYTRLRCFTSYGRVSQHRRTSLKARLRCCLRLYKTQGSVSPWNHTHGSNVSCPTAAFRNIVSVNLVTRLKAPFRHDTTLPTRAPMFRILRSRFATSSMPSCSTVRLSIAYVAWGVII